VFTYFYDYANRNLKTEHIDAGTKFLVPDVLSRPIEARDSKGSLVLSAYDILSRPTKGWCRDNSEEDVTLRSKTIFGDAAGLPDPQDDNLLGKPYKVYDEAGLTTLSLYDFKGNLLEKNRKVIKDSELLSVFDGPPTDWEVTPYRVDWTTYPYPHPDPDSILEGDYQTSMEYDALNRIRTMYYPQDLDSERKQVLPFYNKSGALVSVDIKDNPSATPVNYIQRMTYNAKGQPLLVALGNGVMTRYLYREDNFRLLRMKSEKYSVSGLTYAPSSGTVKQNLSYVYDLSGNIVSISDTTPGCGYGATPDSLTREFSYDALYRLLSASGRETAAYSSVPWQDFYRPENTSLARGYTQTYDYDKLGNIQSLQHVATGGSFTRAFDYVSGKNSLASITIGSNVYNFSHDVNGNITSEGDTARHLQYDYADRLRCFFVQTGIAEPSKYTQYLYDGSGQRVKKITRKQGGGYSSTCYIDGIFEYTKETSAFDAIPNLEIGSWVIGSYSSGGEQNILHIMGGATRRIGDSLGDSTPTIKFALADQLGSSNLLVDDVGTNVNREEYYPFGETSFGSYAKKRYRFCGKEKDEESGLYYYGMRYYSPWTCRFISVDPLAASYPMKTPYHYCSNNPINNIDPTGAEDQPSGGAPQSPPTNTEGNGAPNTGDGGAPQNNSSPPQGKDINGDGVIDLHKVIKNDTYGGLAKKYGVSIEDLRKWNGYADTQIPIGANLIVSDPNTNKQVSQSVNNINPPKVSWVYKSGNMKGSNGDDLHGDNPPYPSWQANFVDNNYSTGTLEAEMKNSLKVGTSGVNSDVGIQLFNFFKYGGGYSRYYFQNSDLSKEIAQHSAFITMKENFERMAMAWFKEHGTLEGFNGDDILRPISFNGTESVFLQTTIGGTRYIRAEILYISTNEASVVYTIGDIFGAGTDDGGGNLKGLMPGLVAMYVLQHYRSVKTSIPHSDRYMPFELKIFVGP
jgi:RHS repeat-associated protein